MKKILTLFISVLLVFTSFAFVGCNNENTGNGDETWEALFDFSNVTSTCVMIDKMDNTEQARTGIKINHEIWERTFTKDIIDFTYYDFCTVSYDGNNYYINGEKVESSTINGPAYFIYADFSDNQSAFTKTDTGYTLTEEITKVGYKMLSIDIVVNGGHIESIKTTCTATWSQVENLIEINFQFSNWGTTVVEVP